MKTQIKFCLIFLMLAFSVPVILAEDLTEKEINNDNVPAAGKTMGNWYVGGDIGATFGDLSQISISPLIGYRFNNQVSSGLQFIYNHSWQEVNTGQSNQTNIESNTYGGNVFVQYNPISEFYLKAEFEYDSYSNFQTTQNTTINQAVPFLFLGAGYSKSISKIATINAGIKFDILNNINSPYESGTPFFYVGTGIGI